MSRRGLRKYLKDNHLLNIFQTDDYVEEFRKVFGNNFELAYNSIDWLKIHVNHRDGRKYELEYYKETKDSLSQPYQLFYAGCSLGWTGDKPSRYEGNITEPVRFINDTLLCPPQDSCEEKVRLLAWLTQYLRTSYRRIKSMHYDANFGTQPAYPDCLVLKYELFQSEATTFGHKTNKLRLELTDNRAVNISLYKFKRFAKREYERKLTLFSTRLIEEKIKGILQKTKHMDNKLDFGEAIKALKNGKKVAREGWNGKGMFLYYVPAASYPAMTEIAKAEWGENALVPYTAYIAMKTVQGEVVPWLASQTDVLSEDWCILD